MKKPTQKQIKEYLKDISNHFSALIDASIWYEEHDMEDWANEIISHIEKLSNQEEADLLFKDLIHRQEEDFDNYSYQRLWWALINQNESSINQQMLSHSTLAPKLHSWHAQLNDDTETKINLSHLLKI